jgi:hypothetical protein
MAIKKKTTAFRAHRRGTIVGGYKIDEVLKEGRTYVYHMVSPATGKYLTTLTHSDITRMKKTK